MLDRHPALDHYLALMLDPPRSVGFEEGYGALSLAFLELAERLEVIAETVDTLYSHVDPVGPLDGIPSAAATATITRLRLAAEMARGLLEQSGYDAGPRGRLPGQPAADTPTGPKW